MKAFIRQVLQEEEAMEEEEMEEEDSQGKNWGETPNHSPHHRLYGPQRVAV
jgi:hypothetical protein